MRVAAIGVMLLSPMGIYAAADEPTVVSCHFERLPLMILTFRGGMGADDNTLQIGQSAPVPLHVGSSMLSAEYGAQALIFSLRLPTNVSISAAGQNTLTYYGDCVSTLQPG